MKTVNWFIMIVIILTSAGFAAQPHKSKRSRIITPTASRLTEFSLALAERIENESTSHTLPMQEPNLAGGKSVGKAVLFSTLVPGGGQMYGGSVLKGATFLAVEVATIFGYVHFQNRGNDLERQFEGFADQNWSEVTYWNWMYDQCAADPSYSGAQCQDISGHQSLRDYENWRSDFSHFLPEKKGQQYYENIGKYDQFNIGWIDAKTGGSRDSEKRQAYVFVRKDANDNFKRATNMVTITLFNHVLSALDAGVSVKRHNRKIAEASFRMEGRLYNQELVPTFKLSLAW